MEYDMLMYERVFRIIKNKIESGLLPPGTSLSSRADLCLEFGTSEKTVRRALAMLEEKGYIETSKRKRPVVAARTSAGHTATAKALQRIDTEITNDVLKTGILLCYPVIKNGISLCGKKDLEIPRKILENMDIDNASEFWKMSKRFIRFFVLRNENALILQAVDGLGLSDLRPLHDDGKIRARYYTQPLKQGAIRRASVLTTCPDCTDWQMETAPHLRLLRTQPSFLAENSLKDCCRGLM